MAKNRTYTGNRQSVGTPTLSRNNYMQLMRQIRKERERIAEVKREASPIQKAPEAT
jgi:hypothetical protein